MGIKIPKAQTMYGIIREGRFFSFRNEINILVVEKRGGGKGYFQFTEDAEGVGLG